MMSINVVINIVLLDITNTIKLNFELYRLGKLYYFRQGRSVF